MTHHGNHTHLIDRLIARHGEGGLSPSRTDWEAIFTLPEGKPIFVLSLLAFSPEVDATGLSGAAAYARFVQMSDPVLAAVGGEQVFFGPVHHTYGLATEGSWDAVFLSRFPSPQAMADMWLTPAFVEARQAKMLGLARNRVVVIDAAYTR